MLESIPGTSDTWNIMSSRVERMAYLRQKHLNVPSYRTSVIEGNFSIINNILYIVPIVIHLPPNRVL